MRPRVFPAEDVGGNDHIVRVIIASMRPRVFPAEDVMRKDSDARHTRLQ